MSDKYTVKEIIEVLQNTYKPEDKILIMWWDKTLPYVEHTVSDSVWQSTLENIGERALDIPSEMIWDVITENIELAYKELGM